VERFCFTFELAAGMEDEYERRHATVWPELEAALKDAGFSNYSIFRQGTLMIGYVECEPTADAAFAKLEEAEVTARWNDYIRDIMTRTVDDEGRLFAAREVWHLD
jgi:L-rhamnose mutarotase